MPSSTFPLGRLGHFRAELHATFTRRADALFELGDALLCARRFRRCRTSVWSPAVGAAGVASTPP